MENTKKQDTPQKEDTKDIFKILKQLDNKKYFGILVLVVTGAALLILGDFFGGNTNVTSSQPTEEKELEEIAEEYEKSLVALVEQVSGAGKASVMVTMETGTEKIYAKAETSDERFSGTGTNGDDVFSYSSEYVIVEDENGIKTALVEKEYQPTVKGVAVLCEGGGDIKVISEITELVCVVMGVTSNRVYVGELL